MRIEAIKGTSTDLSWLYVPEQRISFGRIHEPPNWGAEMAQAGDTWLLERESA